MILQAPRNIVSPRPGNPWDSSPPTREGEPGFDDMLQQVVDAVKMTEMGAWSPDLIAQGNPTELGGEIPALLKDRLGLGSVARPQPKRLALAVSMDKPWHLGEWLIDQLLADGQKFQIDKPGTIQFCDQDASYMQTMTDLQQSTSRALDRVFDIKYAWEQPRPEDYLEIPGKIFAVDNLGSPGHWSFGAGHAAAAAATARVIIRAFRLAADLAQEVIHACWTFAMGRTLLGVHFHEDNVEGFRVGLQVG